jgi:hypothetical protein
MLLDQAISTVCSEVCLQLGAVVAQAAQPVRITPGKVKPTALSTWLVHDTQMFTLIKCGVATLAYCHGNKTLFYAKPEFMLKHATPDGHAFLAQLAEDRQQGGEHPSVPRLLIMDLVAPRIQDAGARYERLRQLAGPCLPGTCVLQWAGQPDALRAFLQNGLPHEVAGIVALGAPLTLTKELRVSPPPPAKLEKSGPREAAPDTEPGEAKRARHA